MKRHKGSARMKGKHTRVLKYKRKIIQAGEYLAKEGLATSVRFTGTQALVEDALGNVAAAYMAFIEDHGLSANNDMCMLEALLFAVVGTSRRNEIPQEDIHKKLTSKWEEMEAKEAARLADWMPS